MALEQGFLKIKRGLEKKKRQKGESGQEMAVESLMLGFSCRLRERKEMKRVSVCRLGPEREPLISE